MDITINITKYFAKSSLIPAIIQEKGTNKVLMLAYMNEESLLKTMETGFTWFFSRSRNELWNKGATSGNVQKVISITADCDDDTLLIIVDQTGPACHTGNKSCFYNNGDETVLEESFRDLYNVILDRKSTFTEGSYTCYLFKQGIDKILKKCGEECSEVIISAKNLSSAMSGEASEKALNEAKNEICDLLYHLTVLMVNEGITLDEIYEILQERSQKIGNLKKFHESDISS